MDSFPQIRKLAAFSTVIALVIWAAGCGDSAEPTTVNPQATATSFVEALRTGDQEMAAELVLQEEDLAEAVVASTHARLALEQAYREQFDGTLADDPNLTLLRLAREPSLVQDGSLDLQGDVALLDVGDGKQLRFELDGDEWKLDLAASLGLEGDAVKGAIASHRANAEKWSAIAEQIRSGEFADKDAVVSALMNTAAGATVGNPQAGD